MFQIDRLQGKIGMIHYLWGELYRMSAEAIHGSKLIGLGFVFVWFLIGGIAHFVATNMEIRIVPPYIPWPRATVLLSGVAELVGALGLLHQLTRRAAGVGLFFLTMAVTPAHIYMLQRPDLFSVPYWMLVLRLPLQAALLALIAWSTSPSAARAPTV
jgi:uncharacterized membrane protein